MKKRLITAGLLLTAGIAALAQTNHDNEVQQNLNVFNAIMRMLEGGFVDSIPVSRTMHEGVNAMLYSLDPYTEYFTAEEQRDWEEQTSGDYGGIGITIPEYDGQAYFGAPMEGYAAQRAGLRWGDKIIRVDTVDMRGKGSAFARKHIRGQAGTPVTITVVRPDRTDSIVTVTLVRERLHIPAVSYAALIDDGNGGKIGFVSLDTFSETAAQEMRKALESFKADPKLSGVVLDLRGNGGGLLNQAVEIVGMFVPRGTTVVEVRGRNPETVRQEKTTKSPVLPKVPLVVLIDNGSASASEVVAGSLQDLDRAVLVGTRSFGKGLVQSTLELPGGSMLKMTTAKYYLPSGRLIQALDYKNRNEDGSPRPIPDSLATVHYTAGGRPVLSGGALKPDVEVKAPNFPTIVYKLYNSPYIFNYITRYHNTHPSIAPAAEFSFTDEEYEGFKNYIRESGFTYKTQGQVSMEHTAEIARKEGILTPELSAEIDSLAAALTPPLDVALDSARHNMEMIILPAIAELYYFQPGTEEVMLRFNPELDEAKRILTDPKRYADLLKPTKKQSDR